MIVAVAIPEKIALSKQGHHLRILVKLVEAKALFLRLIHAATKEGINGRCSIKNWRMG